MALGRQRARQADMLVARMELPRSPGHAFYDKLQTVLIAAGFDTFSRRYVQRHMRRAVAVRRCRLDATSACC
jgi:hypothetical protein